MRQVWNVSALGLVLDASRPAVKPARSVMVEDDVADELTAGPDWSFENPRKPPVRRAKDSVVVKGEKAAVSGTVSEETAER